MKKTFLIILIIGSLSSCKSSLDELLTRNTWEVDKVIDLKTGVEEETENNHEKSWDFNLDNTYQYVNIFNSQRQFSNGEWDLHEYNLSIINKFDSTKVLIEKITYDEMVWLIEGKDSIRIYLSSIPKKINVPNFPSAVKPDMDNNASR
jgi:hypothetical protein